MNTQDAVDEMMAVIKAVADAVPCSFVTEDIPPVPHPLSLPSTYIRAIVRHATGRQSSLSGADSKRMYEATGTLWIEVNNPTGTGNAKGYSTSDMVMDACRAKRPGSSVWFRNVRLHEAPAVGASKPNQVLVDFTYSTLR
jgi:hypothetical protein